MNFNYKDLSSRLQPSDNFKYTHDILYLIKKLKELNINNLRIKNYDNPVNFYLIDALKKKTKKIFINKNFYETLIEYNLIISTYNSTTF